MKERAQLFYPISGIVVIPEGIESNSFYPETTKTTYAGEYNLVAPNQLSLNTIRAGIRSAPFVIVKGEEKQVFKLSETEGTVDLWGTAL